MTLVQLANFVRVAELQNVSRAAALIGVAQPALSRQIRSLETELGAPLLVRRSWGVSVTPAGEILVERARRLLREAQSAKEAVQALAAEPSGQIDLGVPSSVATTLLPDLAVALRAKYPRLRPRFIDGFSAALHGLALAGELDLALLYAAPSLGPLDAQPLLQEDLMLVGPAGADVRSAPSAQMLQGRALILPARPNRLRLIVDTVLPAVSDEVRTVFEVDSLSAIAGMVECGAGFTVLPYSTVAAQVERGVLAVWPLDAPRLTRTLVLATPHGRQKTRAVSAVSAEIADIVWARAQELRWRPRGDAVGA